ncbi:AraC family transcriptional regulator [Flagellimonas nanhaiensis]|uniref:AraC family transcriptional regulator n=1 Tax=Flagellimonas nanhaiensis TaxID=2292706 RepID=A0A371JVB8_9FLAO|nr:AraC family transcriptional regulator [Allomuricauda nanhaiensis]RDY61761.1 AraC family transcriptional regulator [Allomuricauda nanhaiensis]
MKVYDFKIPKKPGQHIVLQRDRGIAFFDKLHQHSEIQITQIITGHGKLIVGDSVHSYEDGDCFVIGSEIPHLFKSSKSDIESHMISLFFAKNSFGPSFFDQMEFEELKFFFQNSELGFKVLLNPDELSEEFENFFGMGHLSRFIAFLNLLKKLNDAEKTILSEFVPKKEISKDQGERLRVVFDYVIENFQHKVDLETVARLVHMTPNSFCRFFKQRTNKTFFKFLIEVRIEHACQLLINNRDLSIAEAAHLSGFQSISNFNKKFKEIKGVNPLKYLSQIS